MRTLQDKTSYRPVGFQYSPKFKQFVGEGKSRRRKWDGKIKLLKHSKFPVGLLERVCTVLRETGVDYDVVADPPREFPRIPIFERGIQRREFQDRAVESALTNPRGVVRAPTGAGKSLIAARIIVEHGRRALVIVPTIDLLYQFKGLMQEHLLVPGGIGQLGDGVVDPREITVATIRTIARAMDIAFESYEYGEYDDSDDTKVKPSQLRNWINGVGLLIVDEAHILGADTVYDVATTLDAPHKVGMSASPWRDDGADLKIEAAVGPLIFRVGTEELVDQGYLVPPIIKVIDTKGMWRPQAWDKGQYGSAYSHEIVHNDVRNQLIADEVGKSDDPTLVLVRQVNHGRALEDLIPDSIFLSGSVSGSARTEVYDDMRAGQVSTLICTSIADMGLDLPILRRLVLAGGGKSSTRHLQRIGRTARAYPGKESALIVDFDDGHIEESWFGKHASARRKIEHAEWDGVAVWI